MWLFFSTVCVGLFPLWQGRKTMAHTVKSMVLDLTGKKKPPIHGRVAEIADEDSGSATPEEKVTPNKEG
jgi:hypothetical protein